MSLIIGVKLAHRNPDDFQDVDGVLKKLFVGSLTPEILRHDIHRDSV